ncbi:MAG: outer membrane protein assembly factor BamA [Gammaproteobacteria bacterium]
MNILTSLSVSARRSLPLVIVALVLTMAPAKAQQGGFVVRDIKIEGLGRITDGAVFNYLPIDIGDQMTLSKLQETLRAVYASGFFSDAQLRRDGDVLVIVVRERPAIASFDIEGNKDIKTEDLKENLRGVGLAPGKSFDQSVLDEVKQYLTSEYFNRGKYGATVAAEVTELEDNRVDVMINIKEGARAQIKQINLVGNEVFDDDELRDELTLRTPNLLSFFRKDDRYSREALEGDLEVLRSYYMDRGYANFDVSSTQVAISPDKKDVYVTINMDEGDTYTVADVTLSGDLVISEAELNSLVLVKPGQTFSRKLMTQTNELISFRLGGEGFAQAEVQPIPDIDPETRTVSLDLRVIPGERVYVRDIVFKGSKTVDDDVFRREMRQMESGWLSNTAVERSQQRIARLPFVEQAEYETVPVAGSADMVDIEFEIEEGLPGQFGGGLGFSQVFGLSLNGNFTHSNFLGRGNRLALDINAGDFSKVYSLSHTNPYATPDGVSRSLGLSYTDTTRLSIASSSFASEIVSLSVDYGWPLSEFSRINFGAVLQDTELQANAAGSRQGLDWISQNGDTFDVINADGGVCGASGSNGLDICGTQFQALELVAGWLYDSRDRFIFPRRGVRQRLSLNMTVPGSDVEYYVARYDFTGLFPLWRNFILGWNVQLAFGEDMGDTTALPPYKNFFAGGPDSVRGFRQSRLGPVDSIGNFFGGNMLTVSQLSLILPTPEKLAASTRLSLFWDVGNVFSTNSTVFRSQDGFLQSLGLENFNQREILDYDFDVDSLRHSVGVAVEWLAPLGTFRFSYALPFNPGDDIRTPDDRLFIRGDELERFQFSIGRSF